MANEEVLDINKFIEKRKKKQFKIVFNDIEILLLHDAPFIEIDEDDDEDAEGNKIDLKEIYFESFRRMTVPEDVDKWDEIENDPDVGQATAVYIYEYIQAAVGDRKSAKKEPQDHKKKSK